MAKIRISRELYDRAAECATEVCEPLGRWMALCQREDAKVMSAAHREAIPQHLVIATRGGSLSATVGCEVGDAAEFRRNVAAAVLFCEGKRPPPFVCPLREGVDYLVERNDA